MTTLPCDCSFTSWNPCSCSNFPTPPVGPPGGGTTQIFGGTGSPITHNANPDPGIPTASVAIWIQVDSFPPNQTTAIWINGVWQ